jgi:hypothetical protein
MSNQQEWISRVRARAQVMDPDSKLRELLLDGAHIMEDMSMRMDLTNGLVEIGKIVQTMQGSIGPEIEKRITALEQRAHPIVEIESEVRRILKDNGYAAR